MLLNDYLGSLRVCRRQIDPDAAVGGSRAADIPAPTVPAALSGLVNLASMRGNAALPAAARFPQVPASLSALVRAGFGGVQR